MDFDKSDISRKFGFNRYIVECKWEKDAPRITKAGGFNRYIVECKYVCVYWG